MVPSLRLVPPSQPSGPVRQLRLVFPVQLALVQDARFGARLYSRRLLVHAGLDVDGRSGRQWYRSIAEYLVWRSARGWLPVSFRFHPESLYYMEGLNTLNSAFRPGLVEPARRCPCVYCVTGRPFADERQTAKVAA